MIESIEELLDIYECSEENLDWSYISESQKLSEEFIERFADKVEWYYISSYQKLSEEFIEKFADKVDWYYISFYQKLSEDFIEKFADKVDWYNISSYQKLSEEFIEKFADKVDWNIISYNQKLSEEFIERFADKVRWNSISQYQKLSEEFIDEHSEKVDKEIYESVHKEYSSLEKLEIVRDYVKRFGLRFDEESGYLYAFREHDSYGRGMYNKTLSYESGRVYRDWKCDMRVSVENSFGLGIFPKGNTPVRVHFENFGVEVKREDGKCRVWEFEVL